MKVQNFFFLVLFLSAPLVSSYNFLVFCPLFAHSHHKFLAKIADTLTDAGHNVTFLAPIIVRTYENVKYLESTKDIIYIQPDEELEKIGEGADYSDFWTEEFGVFSMVPAVKRFYRMFSKVYENIGKDLKVLDELKDRKFDAMIFESLAWCAHPIHDYLEIKTLFPSFSMTHFTDLAKNIGEPSSPSVIPTTVSPYGDQMSFEERFWNTLGDLAFTYVLKLPVIKSYKNPSKVVDIANSESRAPFVFLNSNPFIDFPRPTLTKTVPIGGISVNVTEMRMEKLSAEFQRILAKREKNVLISFGSMMQSKDMPDSYKSNIVRVIESFPDVTFIWKYESNDVSFGGNLKNLHFSKWVPQTALLADSRLSVFITHAGLGSVNELSYLGKPAILIPIFADQLRNAKMLARHNGSIELHKRELADYGKLRNTIKTILEVPSYKINAETLALQLENQPVSPHDLLVKYAEFGARFGELPSLDPYSRQMSFVSFFMIDIILFSIAIILISLVSIFYFFQFTLPILKKTKVE